MQDKDSEVLNYQRKRRKRITKIRYSIILIVAGWIVLSMILVVVLFVKMTSLEHKLDQLVTSSSEQNTDQINAVFSILPFHNCFLYELPSSYDRH